MTPWAAVHQAPPPMGFSRHEYWNEVPLPSPNYLETFPKIEFTKGVLVFVQIVFWSVDLYVNTFVSIVLL